MRQIRSLFLISAIVFLALSVFNASINAVYAIRGFSDPSYYATRITEIFPTGVLTEEDVLFLSKAMTWYYLAVAVESGIGVFFDIFYIQSCRNNFPIKKKLFITLGILGIVFSQILPGILCIILGAKYGDKPVEETQSDKNQ